MAFRINNLNQFNNALKEFSAKTVPSQHLALQKRIALDLLRRIVFRTPVDTGRARGNWQTQLGGSGGDELDVLDPSGGAAISKGASVVKGAKPYGIISLFNNVKYIKALEDGSSGQAPRGMVSVSLVEVEAQFK